MGIEGALGKRFSEEELALLAESKISQEEANGYIEQIPELGCVNVIVLKGLGISPSYIEEHKHLKKQILQAAELLAFEGRTSHVDDLVDWSLIATGSSGCLLRNYVEPEDFDDVFTMARKFSNNAEKEHALLLRIGRSRQPHKNLVRLKFMEDFNPKYPFIDLEYISGETLDTLVKKHKSLSYDKVLRYGAGIINGLVELRRAGIWYHRDIKPKNIVVNRLCYEGSIEPRDDAVIVDLGEATTDRRAHLPRGNRKFGGYNDLRALAETMYYMAKGECLFGDHLIGSASPVKNQVKEERDSIYDDPKKLEECLEKVDTTIDDKRIRDLIKACLTAKNYQYRKMQRLFERYVK